MSATSTSATAATSRHHHQRDTPVWCDSQASLNDLVSQITSDEKAVACSQQAERHPADDEETSVCEQHYRVKVIQSVGHPLALSGLWTTLRASKSVASLSLIGVQLDQVEAMQLAQVLRDSSCGGLRSLQVCSLLPNAIPAFCRGLESAPPTARCRF